MSDFLCGQCCFAKNLNLPERKSVAADIIELITVNPTITVLCPDCDRQFVIKNGVLTTKIPYKAYTHSDKQRALAEANKIMQKRNGGFDLEEDASLQMDFFEIMRGDNNG